MSIFWGLFSICQKFCLFLPIFLPFGKFLLLQTAKYWKRMLPSGHTALRGWLVPWYKKRKNTAFDALIFPHFWCFIFLGGSVLCFFRFVFPMTTNALTLYIIISQFFVFSISDSFLLCRKIRVSWAPNTCKLQFWSLCSPTLYLLSFTHKAFV